MPVEKLLIHKFQNHPALVRYAKWKAEHPDEGFQYDEIFEFLNECSRGEVLYLFDLMHEAATTPTNKP